MEWNHRVAALLLAFVVSATAFAYAATPNVQLKLSGSIVTMTAPGKTAYLPLNRPVKTGEIVRYTIVAHNAGTAPAFHLMPSGNIPPRTVFVKIDQSPQGASVEYTADGKQWSKTPMKGTRSLRWTLSRPLPKDATSTFAYEVRVK